MNRLVDENACQKDRVRYIVDKANNILIRTRLKKYCPPMPIIRKRSSAFIESGGSSVELLVKHGGLKPDERVLDVGCGPGRVSRALVDYLSSEGSYCGIDVSMKCIDTCNREIAAKSGNFKFIHADVYNGRYNPKGKIEARDFRFPFGNESLDFIFLFSVFTHMLEEETEHYLAEIERVLAPSGRCFMTFFILSEERLKKMGQLKEHFNHRAGHCMVKRKSQPERAVAYPESFLDEIISGAGLEMEEPIWWGTWGGEPPKADFLQDIIIAKCR